MDNPNSKVTCPWATTIHRFGPIVLVALLVKAVLLFAVLPAVQTKLQGNYGVSFADDYAVLARNIIRGDGYRFTPETASTLMREPGYPLLLAGVFTMWADRIEAARLANLLLSAAIAFGVTLLACRVSSDQCVGAVASLTYLFHPAIMIAEARGGVEILFILLLMIFLYSSYRAIESERYRDYFIAGISLGAVVLTRGTPILFPLVLLGYLLVGARHARAYLRGFGRMTLLVVATLTVLSPWVVRNYTVSGQLVPTASVQGVALQTGQYICAHMSLDRVQQRVDAEAARERDALAREWGYSFMGGYYQYFYNTADELAFNRALSARTIDRYIKEPQFWTGCMARNLFNFWFAGKNWRVTWFNVALQLPFLIFAAVGAWSLWRAKRWNISATLILLLVFYLYGLHVPIHAQARYSVPLIPFLGIFASVALVAVWRSSQRFLTGKGLSRGSVATPGQLSRSSD